MKKYALFSVNETKGVVHFAKTLTDLGWSIIATSKPYSVLMGEGIDVISINEFVGMRDYPYDFPPTLHPKVEHSLTSNTTQTRIELVYDITYEFDTGNDIGGHTLLALAAKGDRLPVSSYEEMVDVTAILTGGQEIPSDKRMELIAKINLKSASHYARLLSVSNQRHYSAVTMVTDRELLNGENPYQTPSDLMRADCGDSLALHSHRLLTDNVPCFTNMADIDCLVDTLCKLVLAFNRNRGRSPYITVAAKHGNACGIGVDWKDPAQSVHKALWGNPLAVWGGEVVVNFPLSQNHAVLLYSSKERELKLGNDKWMQDIVLAPEIEPSAFDILRQRKNTKLFVNKALANPGLSSERWVYRYARGGALRQPLASYILDLGQARWIGEALTEQVADSLIIAWGCSFTSNHGGNEVAIARDGCLLGVGGGPSTVDAAEVAVLRSSKYHKNSLSGAVFAADAFFPFTDAPEILYRAGCMGGVVPSGGLKETKIIEYFNERNMRVALLNGEIRGFCRH